MNNLVAAGVDVIGEDLAFDAEPAFQRGVSGDDRRQHRRGRRAVCTRRRATSATRHTARVTATGSGQQPDGTSNTFTGCTNTPDNVVAIAAVEQHDVRRHPRGRHERERCKLRSAMERTAFDRTNRRAGGFTEV